MITKSDTKDTAKYHLRVKSVLELINRAELDLGTSSNPVVARGLAGGLPIPPPPPHWFWIRRGLRGDSDPGAKAYRYWKFLSFFQREDTADITTGKALHSSSRHIIAMS